jgi:hypothetical protein
MTEEKVQIEKCTHPNLRNFTFTDGKTIFRCPALLPSPFKECHYKNPCTEFDTARAKILQGKNITVKLNDFS